ncbi:MAG: DNA translocase FtsK 4TM domain-containing protein, partial [Bacteroidota bacterium]
MDYDFPKEMKVVRGSSERNKQIVAILLIVIALLSFLSIISYSPEDEASADIRFSELYQLITGDELIRQKAGETQNWLGLLGAIISNVLINGGFGYSVVVVPLLLFAWGWTIIRGRGHRRLALFTSYVLLIVLLVSSSIGVMRFVFPDAGIGTSWSGTIGDFVASMLTSMLGKAGAAIALLTALLITLLVVTRIDLKRTFGRLRTGLSVFAAWFPDQIRRWSSAGRPKGDVGRWRRAKGMAEVTIMKPEQPSESQRRSGRSLASRESGLFSGGRSETERSSKETDVVSEHKVPPSISEPVSFRHRERLEEETSDAGEDRVAPLRPIEPGSEMEIDYVFPSVDLLDLPRQSGHVEDQELKANADLLRQKLSHFGIEVESVSVTPGPVVTLYELVPASDVKVSKIVSLADDIALALQARG